MKRIPSMCLCWGLAVFWAIAGIAKLISILTTHESHPAADLSWSAQFPTVLIIAVSVMELIVALGLMLKSKSVGILGGCLLLAGFTVAIMIYPPSESQTCGCLGEFASLDANSMLSRITLLAGLHTLAFALLHSRKVQS